MERLASFGEVETQRRVVDQVLAELALQERLLAPSKLDPGAIIRRLCDRIVYIGWRRRSTSLEVSAPLTA
jgi:hypothetical protein